MKEFSIEEKAKRYEMALERARRYYNSEESRVGMTPIDLEDIFPELKESEDERTRKELLEHCKNQVKPYIQTGNRCPQIQSWIDWLEKQGQTFTKKDKDVDDAYLKGICDAKQEFEKQDEQKPVDKVKPKFKVGDWITDGYVGGQITSIEDNYPCYKIADFMGGINTSIPFSLQDNYHLWTIKDAKKGDVLFQDLMGGKTFIYNGINPDMAILYSFIISNDGEDVLPYHIGKPNTGIGYIEENKNIIHPATKEQRELLFKKMKEAGYEFDFEKKELKKIGLTNFLKSLKERVGCEVNCTDPKEWSEEDEKMFRSLHNLIYVVRDCDCDSKGKKEFSDFLDSLKNRFQPNLQQE